MAASSISETQAALNFCKALPRECQEELLGVLKVNGVACKTFDEIAGQYRGNPELEDRFLTVFESWMIEPETTIRKIKTLNLANADLFALPQAIGNLKQLKNLDLSYTYITSLPESFRNLTNLKILNLGHNRKLTDIPDYFRHFVKLERLELFYTGIKTLSPDISEMSNLKWLYFRADL